MGSQCMLKECTVDYYYGVKCMLNECTDDNYYGVTVHAQRVYSGLLLWGDSACSKSVQRTITMG